MKKGILYILLITYTALLIKPALPFVADIVAHTRFYREHISTVHIENGKLHVHKELVKSAKQMADDDKPVNIKKDNQPTDHILSFNNELFKFRRFPVCFPLSKPSPYLSRFPARNYPPPRLLVI